MLSKWKSILTNWINCYFTENVPKQTFVTAESLLTIISSLRENFSLDESKSSVLEADTVEGFIAEKFPDFLFGNGCVEPSTEEDVYLAASLLLYFVCVSSKNVNVKNAMCHRLSSDDQETIMKFSKCLMESDAVTCKELENAIIEACGLDIASVNTSEHHPTVTQTPPAVRTLHGEVRRLQAALDAERFDRNYLQEELTRSNMRIEKLAKEKEQHKIDVMNLKAKISECCGQETEANTNGGKTETSTKKLLKQIDDLEERLVDTRSQLDDIIYEKDIYKNKVDQLKTERDKWLSVGQQECSKASQLAEQLDNERKNVESLRELVAELRQYNRHNGLDGSQLECDDPNASVHSFGHNASICSEACANVVEVQLSEERAKIVVLKQQIQALQDQLTELNEKSNEERQSLTRIISEKDSDILDLKHRINEEIEEKNNLKVHYSDEFIKLNNEINELEQKIKDNNEHSSKIIDNKIRDIQTLQEEKISLLQSLSDETTKLETVIKTHESTIEQITAELYTEKNSKQKMKEEYENQTMKLKEKVLNRNNELVELQNSVFAKGEQIENLQHSVKKEQDHREQMQHAYESQISQLNSIKLQLEDLLHQKQDDIQQMETQLLDCNKIIEQYTKEMQELKNVNVVLNDQVVTLEQLKNELNNEISNRNNEVEEIKRELNDLKHKTQEQETAYRTMFDERQETIRSLQVQLETELSHRHSLQNEMTQLVGSRDVLTDELSKLSKDFEYLKQSLQEKDSMIDAMDLYLDEEKNANSRNVADIYELNEKIAALTAEITENNNNFKKQLELNEQKDITIAELKGTIENISEENIQSEKLNKELNNKVIKLNNELEAKAVEIVSLTEKCSELSNSEKDKISAIIAFEQLLQDELKKYRELENNYGELVRKYGDLEQKYGELLEKYDKDISKLTTRVQETERILKELRNKSNKTIEDKDIAIDNLKKEMESLEKVMQEEIEEITKQKAKLEKDYTNQKLVVEEFKSMVAMKEDEIKCITDSYTKTISEKNNEVKCLKQELDQKSTEITETVKSKDSEITILNTQISETCNEKQSLESQISDLRTQVNEYKLKIDELVKRNEMDTDKMQEMVHEKDVLADQLTEGKNIIETLQTNINELNTIKIAMMKEQSVTHENVLRELNEKESVIKTLESQMNMLNTQIETIVKEKEAIVQEKNKLNEILSQEIHNKDVVVKENKSLLLDKEQLSQELVELASIKQIMTEEKNCLANEKEILAQQLLEGKSAIDVLVNEKQVLISEKELIAKELSEEKGAVDTHEKEITLLKNELKNEKSYKIELEKKVDTFKNDNVILAEKLNEADNKIQHLIEEKQSLVTDIEALKYQLTESTSKQTMLTKEIELLKMENESIIKNLTEEKAVRDEIENEKKCQQVQIEELNNKQKCEIKNKNEELQKMEQEFKDLKKEVTEKQEISNKISSSLNLGIARVLMALKKEDVQNEVLQQLIKNDKFHETPLNEQCELLVNITDTLTTELALRKNLEKALEHETSAINELRQLIKQKEMQVHEMQIENKSLQQTVNDNKAEIARKSDAYATSLEEKLCAIHQLQQDNQTLNHELNDAKVQLEVKVHSLKEKLIDNENLTEKLKSTYECQIENLNVMSNKLTNYLKDKAIELDSLRKEKEKLQLIIEENNKVIKSLEDEIKTLKHNQEKLITDFESERLVLKNMVSVTESVMEDQKVGLDKTIQEHEKDKEILRNEISELKVALENEKLVLQNVITEKDTALEVLFKEMKEERDKKNQIVMEQTSQLSQMKTSVESFTTALQLKTAEVETLMVEKQKLMETNAGATSELSSLSNKVTELETANKTMEKTLKEKLNEIEKARHKDLEIKELTCKCKVIEEKCKILTEQVEALRNEVKLLQAEKLRYTEEEEKLMSEIKKLRKHNLDLAQIVEDNKTVVSQMEQQVQREAEVKTKQHENENTTLVNKCTILQEFQKKAEKLLEERNKELTALQSEVTELRSKAERADELEKKLNEKCDVITTISKQLLDERTTIERYEEELKVRKRENEVLVRVANHKDTYAHSSQEKTSRDKDHHRHQVDMSTSDLTSSIDSTKTITDLEKILHDKNRTITTLQSDITYLKSLITESETQLLDTRKDLELSQDNCQQLSAQLKKIVHSKNEEIADLKKQVSKMSVTENRATQIIKVSARYQAIILKRIAEIKSNGVLKELTNFGNNNGNGDGELRKSIAGSVTMEDLENFLETTDKHLRRCSERQIAVQKERDRLLEVNRINESEIINMKKFLTELSVSVKTFSSLKEVYSQKLSRAVNLQRSVRRDILSLEGAVSETVLCGLERAHGAVLQDLAEAALGLARWLERCVARTLAPEKLQQAFTSELDRATFHNASLEVQLDELERKFQKLMEEVSRASNGDSPRDVQSATVMEVRAEYEDKLNRMKAKMKQLYQEQITIFKDKQKEEIAVLERELQKARDKLAESSRAYEEHIRGLSAELWNVGEKYLVKKDEADWLRRKSSAHGSLMSLQHVPSSHEERRYSDASSLRSLPVHNSKPKRERRGLHMSDEEGEIFDNRFLHELDATPRARSPGPKVRLSELKWRNSLCPPHLKSSYPVETQFSSTIIEEDIKSTVPSSSTISGAGVRKEVGITAYKKPGPPTPSKQAGRLSATDSELRESLRHEPDPVVMRKTTTPSRIRSLFFSSKTDADGTPRKRMSIFRSKK